MQQWRCDCGRFYDFGKFCVHCSRCEIRVPYVRDESIGTVVAVAALLDSTSDSSSSDVPETNFSGSGGDFGGGGSSGDY